MSFAALLSTLNTDVLAWKRLQSKVAHCWEHVIGRNVHIIYHCTTALPGSLFWSQRSSCWNYACQPYSICVCLNWSATLWYMCISQRHSTTHTSCGTRKTWNQAYIKSGHLSIAKRKFLKRKGSYSFLFIVLFFFLSESKLQKYAPRSPHLFSVPHWLLDLYCPSHIHQPTSTSCYTASNRYDHEARGAKMCSPSPLYLVTGVRWAQDPFYETKLQYYPSATDDVRHDIEIILYIPWKSS